MYFPQYTRQVTYNVNKDETRELALLPFNFIFEQHILSIVQSETKLNKEDYLNLFKQIVSQRDYLEITNFDEVILIHIFEKLVIHIFEDYKIFFDDIYVKKYLEKKKVESEIADKLEDEKEIEDYDGLQVYDLIFEMCELNIPDDLWKMMDFKMVRYYIRKKEKKDAVEKLNLINILTSIASAVNSVKEGEAGKILDKLNRKYIDELNIEESLDKFKSPMEAVKHYQEKIKDLGYENTEKFFEDQFDEMFKKAEKEKNGNN